jgi:Rieske Fe-S protein
MCNSDCQNCKCKEGVEQPQRRKVLGVLVGIINLALIGGIVGPVLGFVGSPVRSKLKGGWHSVLAESELPVGATREVTFSMFVKDGYMLTERKYTVFVRRHDTGLVCFDPACTHLGCRIKHDEKKGRYMCPCHGGVFDEEGKVVSGPPPKPLEQHPVKLEAGKVWVYKEV